MDDQQLAEQLAEAVKVLNDAIVQALNAGLRVDIDTQWRYEFGTGQRIEWVAVQSYRPL
jgi:hypothetical protein